MTEIVVAQRMWQRRGTTAQWTTANPILNQGEIGFEYDNADPTILVGMKTGDGITAWLSLLYTAVGRSDPTGIADGDVMVWDAATSTFLPGAGGGGGGGGISPALHYVVDTGSTADSDPGAGLVKWNHATQASATVLFFDDLTSDGVSLTAMWPLLVSGGFLYMQHASNAALWQIWEITSVTDATGYVKFGATLLANDGAFADGDALLVTIQNGAAGGGGGASLISGLSSMYVGSGTGSPEGVVTAAVGAIYTRIDGTPNHTLYVKEVGSGNTGWKAYAPFTKSVLLMGSGAYTITATDVGSRLNNDSISAVHLPDTGTAGLAVDDVIEVRQSSATVVSFIADTGVTLDFNSALFDAKTRYRGAVVEIKVVANNVYSLVGALADF
jgi:hypothetical protein